MIEFLRPTPAGLVELEGPEKNCWISLSSPSEEDLARLKEIIAIPDETLHTLKDIDEIPIVEKEEGYTFFIIRTPYNNVENDLEYSTVPLGVFVTEDYTVTISYFVNDTVPRMKELKFPFRGKLFVFRLLLVSARIYLTYLKEIHRMMFFLEEKLEETQKNRLIMQLLELEKSLVYFSTSLKSNRILLERVAKDKSITRTEEKKDLIEEAIDENNQAMEMCETYSNILTSTLDAYASVISNNLNTVMKILATITIVMSVPTLVASIYGMNIVLPFQGSHYAFLAIMAVSVMLSLVCVFFFWKKKFL